MNAPTLTALDPRVQVFYRPDRLGALAEGRAAHGRDAAGGGEQRRFQGSDAIVHREAEARVSRPVIAASTQYQVALRLTLCWPREAVSFW